MDQYDPNEDAEDIDDMEDFEEYNFKFMSIISSTFIMIVIFTLVIMIFYRDSRPNELKSIFEPADKYLNGPQNCLDDFITNFKKFIENKEGKERQKEEDKKKRRDNQQVEIDLIKLRLESETTQEEEVDEEEEVDKSFSNFGEFLKLEIETIKIEIEKLKIEKEENEKLRQEVKMGITNNLDKIKRLNEELKIQFAEIKAKKFEVFNFDEIIKEIYKVKFKTFTICSFLQDLSKRRESIELVLNNLKYKKKDKFLKNFNEKCFYNFLFKQKGNDNFIKEIKLKSLNVLDEKVKNVTNSESNEIFEDLMQTIKVEHLNENVYLTTGKEIKDKENNVENILKESQEFEIELFITLSKDLNFYGKIFDLTTMKTEANDFINEFQVISKLNREREVDFEHFNILFKRLERRIQWSKSHTQSQSQPQHTANFNIDITLLECWHKRNLLNLFTDKRLTVFDRFQFYEIETIYNYGDKFNIWLKEKLLLLPPSSEKSFDIKKKNELLSRKEDINKTKIIGNVDEFNDLERILTRKLSIFDHSPYEFVLDRVMKDYDKFSKTNKLKKLNLKQDNLIHYNEGHLFMAAAHYAKIMRNDANTLKKLRDMWPKTVSDDKSLMEEEEKYKNLIIKIIKEKNNNVPVTVPVPALATVPDSYYDLMIKPVTPVPPKSTPAPSIPKKLLMIGASPVLYVIDLINN